MEVPGGKNNKIKVCMAEFFGTFILVTALNLSGDILIDGNGPDPMAAALALFIGIILFGNISGGHFNPAVTTGVYFKEMITGFFNSTLRDNIGGNTLLYFLIIAS